MRAALMLLLLAGCAAPAPYPVPPPEEIARRQAEAEDRRQALAMDRARRAQLIGMYMPVAQALTRCPDPADRREGFVALQDMEFAAQVLIRADPTLSELMGRERAAGERRLNRQPTAAQCRDFRGDLDKSVAWLRSTGR